MKFKNTLKKNLCVALAAMISTCGVSVMPVYADSAPIVTLGESLSTEQQDKVLSFFGVDRNNVDIIYINNQQERQYLEGRVPDATIGTRTISCSYILPTKEGGIVVKTANLTWVTDGMLANALLTSGIENCQVLATAPFPVSGTGALTGVLVSYEKSSGEKLDEEKKQIATEELIVTGEIIDEVVGQAPAEGTTNPDGTQNTTTSYQQITEEQILAILNDIKVAVINGELSEDKVKEIVDARLKEYGIKLTDETYNRLVAYLTSLSHINYGDKIKGEIEELTGRIKDGFDINIKAHIDIDFKTDKGSIDQFWSNVFNFLKYLFGEELTIISSKGKEAMGIFKTVDTDVIQYDEPVAGDPPVPDSDGETQESTEAPVGGVEDTTEVVAETPDTNGEAQEVTEANEVVETEAPVNNGESSGVSLDDLIGN